MLVALADFACYMLCTDANDQTCQLSSLSLCFKVCIFLPLPTKNLSLISMIVRSLSVHLLRYWKSHQCLYHVSLDLRTFTFSFYKMTNKNKYLSGLKKMKSKGTMDVVTHLPPQLPTLSGTIPFFLELSSISNFQKTKACYCWTHFLSHHFLSENVGNNRP